MFNMNLITTIVGFGLSATFIVFVCTRLICRRMRRLEAQQQMLEIDHSRIDLEMMPGHRISGVAPVVVAAIPTMKFNREAFDSVENTQCAICLSDYQEREVLRIMPKCGHSFHVSCIDVWLRKQSTCPVCRLSVHASERTTSGSGQSFDTSETSFQHSQQWLLPREPNIALNITNVNAMAIELEAASRSF